MFRHVVLPLLALALALAPAWADAALYRWVDELGVTHYTTELDTIPGSALDTALEIVASPAPVAATRALPVPPAPPEAAPESTPASASATPPVFEPETAPVDAAPPASTALESPALTPPPPEPSAAPATEPATEPASTSEWPAATPSAQPALPGPSATPEISAGDPRAVEVAELEAQIAADREKLRQMISTKRWDSAELASDPNIREIAERLPRLQAELAALRAETVP